MEEEELARLPARGRIPLVTIHGEAELPKRRHKPGEIDGARLQSFCEGVVTLRLDDSENLPFWAEVSLSLDQLQRWLREEGVEMTWHPVED